jgi:hypothetical protein
VCVESAATFHGESADAEALKKLNDGVAEYTKEFGAPVKASAGQPCNATLRIEFTGNGISATYMGLGERWDGYDLSGQVTLTAPDQPTLTYPFTKHQTPPTETIYVPGNPAETKPETPKDALESALDMGTFFQDDDPVYVAMKQFFGPLPPPDFRGR